MWQIEKVRERLHLACVALGAEERRMLAIHIVTAVALVAGAGRHFLRSTMNDINDDY
jgi:hypothetical protein